MAETLADWLATGPFSLAMSSGFFSFYAHTGMLSSLTRSFAPRLVAGSSAGALVAGAWAAGLDAPTIADRMLALRRDEFWDPALGMGLLRGGKFDRLLRDLLPHTAMSACRVPIKISVFDIARRRTAVLGDDADLADAIRASCAVPALFHPVWIRRRAYWDGGILDRPGLAGVPAGDRVLYHHISVRSPWRRRGAPNLAIPERDHMVTLVLDGLPRSGPFRLDAGRRALELAREATLRALDAPIAADRTVRIAAS